MNAMRISGPELFDNNTVEKVPLNSSTVPNGPSAKSGGDKLLAGASANADLRHC